MDNIVLSPDQQQWWDGITWRPVRPPLAGAPVSEDGRSWWNGQGWEPVPVGFMPPAAPLEPRPPQYYSFGPAPGYTPPGKPRGGLNNWGVFGLWLFVGPFSLIGAWLSRNISLKAKWIWTGLATVWTVVLIIAIAAAAGVGNTGGGKIYFITNGVYVQTTSDSTFSGSSVSTWQQVSALPSGARKACDWYASGGGGVVGRIYYDPTVPSATYTAQAACASVPQS